MKPGNKKARCVAGNQVITTTEDSEAQEQNSKRRDVVPLPTNGLRMFQAVSTTFLAGVSRPCAIRCSQ
jgi:hypothetical protein